jgi:hypothetical protein
MTIDMCINVKEIVTLEDDTIFYKLCVETSKGPVLPLQYATEKYRATDFLNEDIVIGTCRSFSPPIQCNNETDIVEGQFLSDAYKQKAMGWQIEGRGYGLFFDPSSAWLWGLGLEKEWNVVLTSHKRRLIVVPVLVKKGTEIKIGEVNELGWLSCSKRGLFEALAAEKIWHYTDRE